MKRFNEILKRSVGMNLFVILPLMIGFFCVADPFIHVLLGSKWLPCVPYIRIFCIIVIFNTIESVFCYAPMALGKSGLTMFLDILECGISILLLIIAVPFGTLAIAYSMAASSFINCCIYIIAVKKLTGFKVIDCFLSASTSIVSVALMAIFVLSLQQLNYIPYYILLLIQTVSGVLLYFLYSKLFQNDSYKYTILLIKDFFNKKKSKN